MAVMATTSSAASSGWIRAGPVRGHGSVVPEDNKSLQRALSVARSTFMAEGTSDARIHSGLALRAAIGICLAAVVLFGLWPDPLVEGANAAARAFLGGR